MPETLTASFTTLSHPSIAAPKGFHADGQHVGLKHKAKDLGWLISDVPAAVAGVFTTNQVQAAPVQVTKKPFNTANYKRSLSIPVMPTP